jgi:sigma-E factor negative regulatory protein RseC
MIEEIGTVVEVHNSRALVRTEKSSACEGCGSSGLCHSLENKDECTVEAQNPSHARIGQRVRVAIPTSTFLKGTFLLYLFPLIGLFIGMGAGYLLASEFSQGQEDLYAAAGSVIGLILFFILLRVMNRKVEQNRQFWPVITEIL